MAMLSVKTSELKNHLGRYLQKVKEGEIVTITSHSHSVAKIVPYENKTEGMIEEPTQPIRELQKVTGIKTRKKCNAVAVLLSDRTKR